MDRTYQLIVIKLFLKAAVQLFQCDLNIVTKLFHWFKLFFNSTSTSFFFFFLELGINAFVEEMAIQGKKHWRNKIRDFDSESNVIDLTNITQTKINLTRTSCCEWFTLLHDMRNKIHQNH